MLLVTRSDVEARLGRPLTAEEDARFDAAARDASALLYATAPRIPREQPVPDAVVGVASDLVITRLATPPGTSAIAQESLGGYSVSYREAAMQLTAGQGQQLRPWRRPGIGTVRLDPTGRAVAS